MVDVQIIIFVKKEAAGEFESLTAVTTEAQGYFIFDYPQGSFIEAQALVGLELVNNPLPIRLEEKIIDGETMAVLQGSSNRGESSRNFRFTAWCALLSQPLKALSSRTSWS
jgi:hypothetical protein